MQYFISPMDLFIHLSMLFILGILHVTFAWLVPSEGTVPLELELWMVLSFGFFLRHPPDCEVSGSDCPPVSASPGAGLLLFYFTAALYLLY